MNSVAFGVLKHGAAFSKHFAVFTLVSEDGTTHVDCALAGKDGWEVDKMRELCLALGLTGTTTAVETELGAMTLESSLQDTQPYVVEVDIRGCFYETLAESKNKKSAGDENESPNADHPQCAHPLEIRVRRRKRDDCDVDSKEIHTSTSMQKSTNNYEEELPESSTFRWHVWRASLNNQKSAKEIKKKETRASCFAALLVERFGVDNLREGTGVVDVAGGSGELSHTLFYRYGVPCTIVDPRGDGVKLKARHRRLFKSRESNVSLITDEWCDVSPLALSLRTKWSEPEGQVGHVKALFDHNLMHDNSTKDLLKNCSAVVGMHPDQATGAIVDCGLQMNKNWAVVPCCVFPSEHPERVVSGTNRVVRTTEELVTHLKKRALGRAVVELLNCKGANETVWCFGAKEEETCEELPSDNCNVFGTVDWPWPKAPPDAPPPGPFRL